MFSTSRLCSQSASPCASLHLHMVQCVLCLSVLIECLLFQVASVVLVMRGRADGGVSPKPLQPVLLEMPLQVRLNTLVGLHPADSPDSQLSIALTITAAQIGIRLLFLT